MKKIRFTADIDNTLCAILSECKHEALFVITDSNTIKIAKSFTSLRDSEIFSFPAGERSKNLRTVVSLWDWLMDYNADRDCLIINVGGGVVSDVGGFVASTFKRGVRYINIPTTLMGAVDAAIGGKTGFDFRGVKNVIGVINQSMCTIISTECLGSLDEREMKSGYAEMMKCAILNSQSELSLLIDEPRLNDREWLMERIKSAVRFKAKIVSEDLNDVDVRHVLNLGHTIGHAIESILIDKGARVEHGYCVAWGLAIELMLSGNDYAEQIKSFINSVYGRAPVNLSDVGNIVAVMKQDKKNRNGEIGIITVSQVGSLGKERLLPVQRVKEAIVEYIQEQ